MAFAQAAQRPIPGAVATVGVSERVAFLRRTYTLLTVALIAFAALTAAMFQSAQSLRFVMWMSTQGVMPMLLVLGVFIGAGILSQRLAASDTSRGLQYLGLAISVVVYSVMTQPLIWYAYLRFAGPSGSTTEAHNIILQAAVITGAIFVGLTASVFISKKDFSFMRGILSVATFGFLAVLLVSYFIPSMRSGSSIIFPAFGVMLMGGYILYQTSAIMKSFPPSRHVAAALMLFSTVATLFWYVLRLLMNSRRN